MNWELYSSHILPVKWIGGEKEADMLREKEWSKEGDKGLKPASLFLVLGFLVALLQTWPLVLWKHLSIFYKLSFFFLKLPQMGFFYLQPKSPNYKIEVN